VRLVEWSQKPADPRATHWRRQKTLAGQLEQGGIKPSDIKYVAVSLSHPDHIGKVEMFPPTLLLVELSGSPIAIDKQFNEVAIRVLKEQVRSHRTRALSHDLASRLSDCIPGVREHFLADNEAEMNAMMVPRVCVDRNIRLSLERQLLTSCGRCEEDDFIGLQSRCHREESLVKRT